MEKVDQQQTPVETGQISGESAVEAENETAEAVETEVAEEAAMDAAETDEMDMDDDYDMDDDDEESMDNLMALYEESLKRFEEGEVVSGRIISVDKDHVLVDIGYKSEGQVGIHEFYDEDGNVQAEIDDTVEVMVEWWDDENEVVLLSKEKAAKVKV
jgi:small subunit ribosomal protein S1